MYNTDVSILTDIEMNQEGQFHAFVSACARGDLERVEELISINNPGDADNRAIIYASDQGHLEVVERLLQDHRVDPTDRENAAIIGASLGGHLEVVNRLLEDDRVDPSAQQNAAIVGASKWGNLEVVRRLLQCRYVDPTDQHFGAIVDAYIHGHLDVVDILIQDPRTHTFIISAARNGHLVVVDRFLRAGANPAALGNEVIRAASEGGHLDVVRCLLRDDRVNPADHGNRAIKGAMDLGHMDVVRCLEKDPRVFPPLIQEYLWQRNAIDLRILVRNQIQHNYFTFMEWYRGKSPSEGPRTDHINRILDNVQEIIIKHQGVLRQVQRKGGISDDLWRTVMGWNHFAV